MSPSPEHALDDRARTLDTAFYREPRNGDLVDQLRIRLQEEAAKDDLACASGIQDDALLSRLTSLGIRVDTLAALTLIPLIEVAWADGVMEAKEREAILRGAASSGIRPQSPSYGLLEIWTLDRPASELGKGWREFASALSKELEPDEVSRLRENLMSRARAVAEAAGDLLGHGSMISPEEESVLEDLERAFA